DAAGICVTDARDVVSAAPPESRVRAEGVSMKPQYLLIAAVAAVCLVFGNARAESTDERLKALEREVEELKRELANARGTGSGPDAKLAELTRQIGLLAQEIEKLRIGEAAEEPALASTHGLGPAASKIYKKDKGVSIGGYGEALFQDVSQELD